MRKDESLALIIVPGRDDRAFYKQFLRYLANEHELQYRDLDTSDSRDLKLEVLNRVYRLSDAGEANLRRTSVVRLSKSGSEHVDVVILPSEGDVCKVAKTVLGYQGGLDEPTINFIAVVDDAEDRGFDERLRSMRDSIGSSRDVEIAFEIERGKYFQLFALRRPQRVRLMLLVQGLETVQDVPKHAIEDYVLYLHSDILKDIEKRCNRLLEIIAGDGRRHKKLALLIALTQCCTRIEELFLRTLTSNELSKLAQACDGLQKLSEEILRLLNNY